MMPQAFIKIGIQRWAPMRFEIKFEGRVKIVNRIAYTIMVVFTSSFVNPRSEARSSEIAFAKYNICVHANEKGYSKTFSF